MYNWTDPANLLASQCDGYCAQGVVDSQYNALGSIYGRFQTYLLAVALFFIIDAILDKIIYAHSVKKFKIDYFIGSKEFDFNVSDDFIKYVTMSRNIFRMTMLAMALVYYFFGRQFYLLQTVI